MLCLLFLSLMAGVQCNTWEFYLVDSSNQITALNGLLIAHNTGTSTIGTVSYILDGGEGFTGWQATVICKEMGYRTISGSSGWDEKNISPAVQDSYNIAIDDISCSSSSIPFSSCNYDTTIDKNNHDYDVGLTCIGCKENYWRNSNNFCNPCPGDSTSGDDSGHCDCTAGFVWNTNDSDCTSCPGGTFSKSGATQCTICLADTYSLGNATSCSNCPAHSTSPTGSDICDCQSGEFWNQNAAVCEPCPEHATSNNGAVTCSCEAGYKLHNRNSCEICPENTFSKFGAVECEKCPQFKVAAPGADSCSEQCTLGEFWENHKCLPCPENLYGDGVHCLPCPDGFQVENGFCYKVQPVPSLASINLGQSISETRDFVLFALFGLMLLLLLITVVVFNRQAIVKMAR